jgi:hypothetical protein
MEVNAGTELRRLLSSYETCKKPDLDYLSSCHVWHPVVRREVSNPFVHIRLFSFAADCIRCPMQVANDFPSSVRILQVRAIIKTLTRLLSSWSTEKAEDNLLQQMGWTFVCGNKLSIKIAELQFTFISALESIGIYRVCVWKYFLNDFRPRRFVRSCARISFQVGWLENWFNQHNEMMIPKFKSDLLHP